MLLLSLFASGWRKPAAEDADLDCCMLGYGAGNVTMVSALMQAAVVQMCILPMLRRDERTQPAEICSLFGIQFQLRCGALYNFLLCRIFCARAYGILQCPTGLATGSLWKFRTCGDGFCCHWSVSHTAFFNGGFHQTSRAGRGSKQAGMSAQCYTSPNPQTVQKRNRIRPVL